MAGWLGSPRRQSIFGGSGLTPEVKVRTLRLDLSPHREAAKQNQDEDQQLFHCAGPSHVDVRPPVLRVTQASLPLPGGVLFWLLPRPAWFRRPGLAAHTTKATVTLGVPGPDRHGCSRRLGAVVGSPSENVDDVYLPAAARSDELVITRISFEVPDGLGKRSGGFRAWHAVVGQEVNSGLPEYREPFSQWMQRDVLEGQWAHGYQHVLSAAVYPRFCPEMRTTRMGSPALRTRSRPIVALAGVFVAWWSITPPAQRAAVALRGRRGRAPRVTGSGQPSRGALVRARSPKRERPEAGQYGPVVAGAELVHVHAQYSGLAAMEWTYGATFLTKAVKSRGLRLNITRRPRANFEFALDAWGRPCDERPRLPVAFWGR